MSPVHLCMRFILLLSRKDKIWGWTKISHGFCKPNTIRNCFIRTHAENNWAQLPLSYSYFFLKTTKPYKYTLHIKETTNANLSRDFPKQRATKTNLFYLNMLQEYLCAIHILHIYCCPVRKNSIPIPQDFILSCCLSTSEFYSQSELTTGIRQNWYTFLVLFCRHT